MLERSVRNAILPPHQTSRTGSRVQVNMSCPVGLEKQLVSHDFTKKRKLTRKLVKATVRMEQARFSNTNEHEYDRQERIAAASIQHSEWSRSQALTIGDFQSIAYRIDD